MGVLNHKINKEKTFVSVQETKTIIRLETFNYVCLKNNRGSMLCTGQNILAEQGLTLKLIIRARL